jgi:hypothetical protein
MEGEEKRFNTEDTEKRNGGKAKGTMRGKRGELA